MNGKSLFPTVWSVKKHHTVYGNELKNLLERWIDLGYAKYY